MRRWKLEDAKNGFSELVRRALAHEPQLVTRNGRDAVVVMSAEDYRQSVAPDDLATFFRNSPLAEAIANGELELEIERDADQGRDLAL